MRVEEIVNKNADMRAAMEEVQRQTEAEIAKTMAETKAKIKDTKRRIRQRDIGSLLLVSSGMTLILAFQAALAVKPMDTCLYFALFAVLALWGCHKLDKAMGWR